jgi:phage replication-related protein YjqB (UPF0714/DUF867 family)
VDYCRTILPRTSVITVIAPHGGGIEPGTSEIAKAIAGDQFSLYCFEGLKSQGNYKDLHITGTNFDDPDCVQLTGKSRVVLAIHGCDDDNEVVYVGGCNENIRTQLIDALTGAGFYAKKDVTAHSGRNPQNICNRGLPEGGVQLEIAEGLRLKMFRSLKRHERIFIQPPFEVFVNAVQESLNRLNFVGEATQPAIEDGGRV